MTVLIVIDPGAVVPLKGLGAIDVPDTVKGRRVIEIASALPVANV